MADRLGQGEVPGPEAGLHHLAPQAVTVSPPCAPFMAATESQSEPVMVSLLDLAPFTWKEEIHIIYQVS